MNNDSDNPYCECWFDIDKYEKGITTEIKVVNAGNCMICGKSIKPVVSRGYNKLPNIFFCRECEQELEEDIAKTVDSQSDFDEKDAESEEV